MHVSIEYCVQWNYEPKALSLRAALKSEFSDVDVELIEGGGGDFEVVHDGKLIFSKKELGRFPEDTEIFDALR